MERLVLLLLLAMLARIVVIGVRFSYLLARRPKSSDNTSCAGSELAAELRLKLRTLRSIFSTAPYLGLLGTTLGILDTLSGGFEGSRSTVLGWLASAIASALVTTAAGIIVAVPAILAYNFLQGRIEQVESRLPDTVVAANHHCTGAFRPSFRFAQTLRLQKRFPCLPPFTLLAVPALASVVAVFTFFQPYEIPGGLSVQLLSMGSLDGHRRIGKPVLISVIRASGSGSPVVRLTSTETPLDNFNSEVIRKSGVFPQWRVYVEAESTLSWADVVTVLGVIKGTDADVVLLTTTPGPDSRAKKLPLRLAKHR